MPCNNFSNNNQCGSSLHNLLCGASSTECSRPPVRNEREATVIKITADKCQFLRGNIEMPSQFGGSLQSLQSLRPVSLDMQTAGVESGIQSKTLRRRAHSGSPSTLCVQNVNQNIIEEECGAKSHFSSKVTVIEKKSRINGIPNKDSSFTFSENELEVDHEQEAPQLLTFGGTDLKKSLEDFASALLNSQKRLYRLAEKIDESLNWSKKRYNSQKAHRVSQLRTNCVMDNRPPKNEIFSSSPVKRPLLTGNRGPLFYKDENRNVNCAGSNQSFINQVWSHSTVGETPLSYARQFSTISSSEHKRLREVQKRFAQTLRGYIRVRIFLWDRKMSKQDARQNGSCHFYVDQSRKLLERYHYLKQKMKRDFSAEHFSERVANKYVSKTNAVELKTVRLIKLLEESTGDSRHFHNNKIILNFDFNVDRLGTITATKRKKGIGNYVTTSNVAESLNTRQVGTIGGNALIRIPTLDLSCLTTPNDVRENEANENDEDRRQMDDGEMIGSAKTSEGISSIRELEMDEPDAGLEQHDEGNDFADDANGITSEEEVHLKAIVEESVFTEEQFNNGNNHFTGHKKINSNAVIARPIEKCERADREGVPFNDDNKQTHRRDEISSENAIGTPTEEYERAAGGGGVQLYHPIVPESCKSRGNAKNTENDVSSIATFEMPSESEPNFWSQNNQHLNSNRPLEEAAIQMDTNYMLNRSNECQIAEENYSIAKVTLTNIEKFDPSSETKISGGLYSSSGLLNQERISDNLEKVLIQSTITDDNCLAPNDSADFEETLTMSRLLEDDNNVSHDELDLDETLKPAQNIGNIVPEGDASERVGDERPETDRVSSTSVLFSEINETFADDDLDEVVDVPKNSVTDGLENQLKECVEESVVVRSEESFAELDSKQKIEDSVDVKAEMQFKPIEETDSFSNSLQLRPITSNIYDAVIVFNEEIARKNNFSRKLDPSESQKGRESADSLDLGSATVHNVFSAPKNDEEDPPESTASSSCFYAPTISELPISSHLESSLADNVEKIESSGESDEHRNIPSGDPTQNQEERISEELPFSPSQSVDDGSFSMSSSLLFDPCTPLKQAEIRKNPEHLTNSVALKDKAAIRINIVATKSDEPRSPRTPRRVIERFNIKFPSPLTTPTRFDDSADSAASMSLIHSQSSPKSNKNGSFASGFHNLSTDGGQLLDDLPDISSISQILELSRDSLNASFLNSLANEANLRSRHSPTLKAGDSHIINVISPVSESAEGPANVQNHNHSITKNALCRAIPEIRQWLDAIVDYVWENSLHNVEEIWPKHHPESLLGLVSKRTADFTNSVFIDENYLQSFRTLVIDWCIEALKEVKAEKIESKNDLRKALVNDLLRVVNGETYETSQRYLLRQFCERTSHIALDPIRLLVCEEICAHGTEYKWLQVRDTDLKTCNYIVNHS